MKGTTHSPSIVSTTVPRDLPPGKNFAKVRMVGVAIWGNNAAIEDNENTSAVLY
jgi:hypothetical protein